MTSYPCVFRPMRNSLRIGGSSSTINIVSGAAVMRFGLERQKVTRAAWPGHQRCTHAVDLAATEIRRQRLGPLCVRQRFAATAELFWRPVAQRRRSTHVCANERVARRMRDRILECGKSRRPLCRAYISTVVSYSNSNEAIVILETARRGIPVWMTHGRSTFLAPAGNHRGSCQRG